MTSENGGRAPRSRDHVVIDGIEQEISAEHANCVDDADATAFEVKKEIDAKLDAAWRRDARPTSGLEARKGESDVGVLARWKASRILPERRCQNCGLGEENIQDPPLACGCSFCFVCVGRGRHHQHDHEAEAERKGGA